MLGRHYVQHLRAFLGEDLAATGFIRTAGRRCRPASCSGWLRAGARAWRAATYGDLAWPLRCRWCRRARCRRRGSSSRTTSARCSPSRHIDGCRRASDPAQPTAASLLHALLRHALLREYAQRGRADPGRRTGAGSAALLRDAELVDLVGGAPPTLDLAAPARPAGQRRSPATKTIREFLEGPDGLRCAGASRALGEFRAALAHLQTLRQRDAADPDAGHARPRVASARRLDHLVRDAAAGARCARPQPPRRPRRRLRLGREPVPAAASGTPVDCRRPASTAPLFAPRRRHRLHPRAVDRRRPRPRRCCATRTSGTAASPRRTGPLAIDLSSRRLREARWLLDGVRQGQPLGALLGYRFERRLHDVGARRDSSRRFRELAPLVADKLEATDAAGREHRRQQRRRRRCALRAVARNAQSRDSRRAGAGRRAQPPTRTRASASELDALGDAIDAVGDALTAEAAYQIVRGNTSRMASSLAAIAAGRRAAARARGRPHAAHRHRAHPPHGAAVRRRSRPDAGLGRAAASSRARRRRADAQRLGRALLGDAAQGALHRRAARTTRRRHVLETLELPLSELELAPLDVVYGVDASSAARGCAARVGARGAPALPGAPRRRRRSPTTARLRIAACPARRLRRRRAVRCRTRSSRRARSAALFGGARPLDAADLDLPERAATGTLDLAELRSAGRRRPRRAPRRARGARRCCQDGAGTDAGTLREALICAATASACGRVPAVARRAMRRPRRGLRRQLARWMLESRARVRPLSPLCDGRARRRTIRDAGATDLAERLRAVFGAGFRRAAALHLRARGRARELAARSHEHRRARRRSARRRTPGSSAANGCASRRAAGRSRCAAPRSSAPASGSTCASRSCRSRPTIAGSACRSPPAWRSRRRALSLVVQAARDAVDAQRGRWAGCWIDEWVEVVPNRARRPRSPSSPTRRTPARRRACCSRCRRCRGKPWTGRERSHACLPRRWSSPSCAPSTPSRWRARPTTCRRCTSASTPTDDAVSTDFGPLSRPVPIGRMARGTHAVDHQLDPPRAALPRRRHADARVNARIFDPLWMLTRQWQVGEFQAEDAGTPVMARVRAENALLSRCHLGELPPNTQTHGPALRPARPCRWR